MFIRIAWGRVKPGHWEAYKADFERVTAADQPPGLVNRYLVKDLDAEDAGFSVTVWSSQEAMDAHWNAANHANLVAALQDHFTGEFTLTRGRIDVESAAGGPLMGGRN